MESNDGPITEMQLRMALAIVKARFPDCEFAIRKYIEQCNVSNAKRGLSMAKGRKLKMGCEREILMHLPWIVTLLFIAAVSIVMDVIKLLS